MNLNTPVVTALTTAGLLGYAITPMPWDDKTKFWRLEGEERAAYHRKQQLKMGLTIAALVGGGIALGGHRHSGVGRGMLYATAIPAGLIALYFVGVASTGAP